MTSILMLTLAALVIFFFPNWVFTLLASAIIAVALREFFGMVERKGIVVYKYFGIIIGALVPIIIYFQKGIEGYFTLEPFFIVIECLFIFVLQFIRREVTNAV